MNLNEMKLTPKRQEICTRLGLNTDEDILRYYPYRYENYLKTHYKDFKIGETVIFDCELLKSPTVFRYQGNRSVTRFRVLYEENEILVTIYNRPWVSNLKIGNKLTIIGKYEGNNSLTASNYYLKDIEELLGIKPCYSLKEGISNNDISKIVELTLKKSLDSITDDIPEKFINAHKLLSIQDALLNIHKPQSELLLKKAIARLKYEEFLNFYTCLFYLSQNTDKKLDYSKDFDEKEVFDFVQTFPFEFTDDQISAIKDVLNDLKNSKPMDRLIEGEVGSGKTAVCEVCAYAVCLSGYQVALLAPTEILAKQHYEDFKKRFNRFNIELLTSSCQEQDKIKERIKNSQTDIIIGTHSLISDDVKFKKLGLVIVDEQQRFGVKQRQMLKSKGEKADLLLMSATPIPRTLASAIYGDKDISIIETMPKGRKGCKTILLTNNSIAPELDNIKDQLKQGRQVYIVCASIDSDVSKTKDVNRIYKSLIQVLSPYRLAFLHGKMKSEEKEQVMSAFVNNEVQVLVSTTVIEVGISVSNATVMVIYDADRFGMSQLHQLRGRVQRGDKEGLCYLLTASKDEKTLERLKVLSQNNNGFDIAREDLRLRGPGDILGTRQSGLPAFVLGNIVDDTKFIEASKKDAREILDNKDDYSQYLSKIENLTRNLLRD